MRVPHRALSLAAVAAVATTLAACSSAHTASATHIPDPAHTVAPAPDYDQACALSGVDTTEVCVEVTLAAIDNARAKEHVKPMVLPLGFENLPLPQQVFIAVDRERVDRGLPAFTSLSPGLVTVAQEGADKGDLPPDPPPPYSNPGSEWLGAVVNGLDAVYAWMYDDGPGSGVDGCSQSGGKGCWADRHILLDDYSGGTPVMGAALNPTADTSQGDEGGPSLAAIFATTSAPDEAGAFTWAQALAENDAGTIRPRTVIPTNEAASHVPDPPRNVPPDPDYLDACAPTGLDSSPLCLAAIVQATDNARAKEGVKPIALPANFGSLSIPDQLFVAINLERTDRGLPPAARRIADLDRNAQLGADKADDPPDPGQAYIASDGLWAGGSINGLDAVYGFMYEDGPGSTNLDCPAKGGQGCWGHRHGVLDNFGTVGTLVMGTAVNPTGDRLKGDVGGTSMAVTLAVTTARIP